MPDSRERSERPESPAAPDSAAAVLPVQLPAPPFENTPPDSANRGDVAYRLDLRAESAAHPTDQQGWLMRNGLSLPTLSVPNSPRSGAGKLPEAVPRRLQEMPLILAIDQGAEILLVYGADVASGRYLARFNPATGKMVQIWDFKNYLRAPRGPEAAQAFAVEGIRWAWIDGQTLYVGHAHPTYARATDGLNGYITALDLNTRQLLWRTGPRVFNSRQFLLHGEGIISAYGFTGEPDYLFVLDRRSGAIRQKVSLRSMAEDLVMKDDSLFVRTYDREYQFALRRPSAAGSPQTGPAGPGS